MQIRPEQMQAFVNVQMSGFEDRMLVHVEKFFPQHFTALGEEHARELVRYGIERAAQYDLVSERDVCKMVDLMLALGPDMEQKYPWIHERLSDSSVPEPTARLNAMYDAVLESLKKRIA
jgi:hypothetical protein